LQKPPRRQRVVETEFGDRLINGFWLGALCSWPSRPWNTYDTRIRTDTYRWIALPSEFFNFLHLTKATDNL
ncbi:hypothetical protein CRM22_011280, partial [Opisthorchis felineus]